KLAWLLVHGSILSRVGASTKLGAVQAPPSIYVIKDIIKYKSTRNAPADVEQNKGVIEHSFSKYRVSSPTLCAQRQLSGHALCETQV
ncbi:hypothetical protein, partial [Burkholderia sp. ABCPW 11]|uniref:hypothetical protein n=1 Tax=Burkholderia sp. ABCPW 11 TaxID=1637859 RepID=UPI001C54F771